MDIQQLVSELGVPIALSISLMYGCYFLIRYITSQHTILMTQKFQDLTNIHIKLIDQQKQMQLKMEGQAQNVATIVSFIIEAKDKEQERLLKLLEKQNGFK